MFSSRQYLESPIIPKVAFSFEFFFRAKSIVCVTTTLSYSPKVVIESLTVVEDDIRNKKCFWSVYFNPVFEKLLVSVIYFDLSRQSHTNFSDTTDMIPPNKHHIEISLVKLLILSH